MTYPETPLPRPWIRIVIAALAALILWSLIGCDDSPPPTLTQPPPFVYITAGSSGRLYGLDSTGAVWEHQSKFNWKQITYPEAIP